MEENLLNELENMTTSTKCFDDLTNNNYCIDDEQVCSRKEIRSNCTFLCFFFWKDTSLLHQLAIKDRQLILAAKCGKVLLEEKEELERQIDLLNHDYQQRIDVRL